MTAIATCALCQQPLDPRSPMTLRKVSGYAGSRSAGGINALRLRKEHEEYVHAICADRVKQGHRFGQLELTLPERSASS